MAPSRMLCAFAVISTLPLFQKGRVEASHEQFRATADLVVAVVTVSGKDGEPVTGLQPWDFEVTDNGVPTSVEVIPTLQARWPLGFS